MIHCHKIWQLNLKKYIRVTFQSTLKEVYFYNLKKTKLIITLLTLFLLNSLSYSQDLYFSSINLDIVASVNQNGTGILNLDYFAEISEEITISVFDITGKLASTQSDFGLNGNNKLNFDFSALQSGIFIVKIGDQNSMPKINLSQYCIYNLK